MKQNSIDGKAPRNIIESKNDKIVIKKMNSNPPVSLESAFMNLVQEMVVSTHLLMESAFCSQQSINTKMKRTCNTT